MTSTEEFEGKRILITGASSGIGKACCQLLSSQGASLILLARDETKLMEVVKSCACPEKHSVLPYNLASGDYENLKGVIAEMAPISGIVHCAGVSPTAPFKVLKKEQIRDTFELNVFSFMELIKIISNPKVKDKEAMSVVAISSVLSEVGEKGKALYAMTKSSLVALVKCLALEYADKNIRFNTVSPSVVNTPLTQKSVYRNSEEAMSKIESKHPLGLGEPEDVAHAVSFLLSQKSRWVTGTNLIVDGGYLAN